MLSVRIAVARGRAMLASLVEHLTRNPVQMYTMSQAVFGVGVGGEYPIASTSASERAEADESLHSKRGETVMLTFSMQGAADGFAHGACCPRASCVCD